MTRIDHHHQNQHRQPVQRSQKNLKLERSQRDPSPHRETEENALPLQPLNGADRTRLPAKSQAGLSIIEPFKSTETRCLLVFRVEAIPAEATRVVATMAAVDRLVGRQSRQRDSEFGLP